MEIVAALPSQEGLSQLDRELLILAEKCPLKHEELVGADLKDSARSVQARWKYLNCIYEEPPTGKRRALVVLLDGTGNSGPSESNIWRLYNRALAKAVDGEPVIPYYDRGVGTNFQRATGSLFGAGVDRNVRQAYRFLVETYKPADKNYAGDRIYIFGFSRGAYTARTLNGMIKYAGLAHLNSTPPDALDETRWMRLFGNLHRKTYGLFNEYTQSNTGEADFDKSLADGLNDYKRDKNIETYDVTVEAIGVFDTVPAIGFFQNDDPDNHRLELYANRGYHAMSIDEQRDDFRLLRFGVPQRDGQRLEEMWFAGVHSDVGGGYYNTKKNVPTGCDIPHSYGLEGISLGWMLKNFEADDIFTNADFPVNCYTGVLHDEYFGSLSSLYAARGIARRRPVACDNVHQSVIQRIQSANKLPLPHPKRESKEGHYVPTNLSHSPDKVFCILPTGALRESCRQLNHDCGAVPK
ncbi:DUF2235 domain-containing protein [Pseudomonas chlororaphis]|uniref:DUF2235 domain-containing protein n=2 Tax=Pseudomonas chlororaphis TaxID=587753 RepID=A0AB34C3I5_9PSED|nr:DUF2235 domain-containing protein [Pseudomonas chlororaphis]